MPASDSDQEKGRLESEELFRIQVECVKDYAIFMLDAQGNVLNWNAGAERLKGYRDEEIIGKHFSCFYPEEERNAGKPEEELKKAAAEGRVEDEGWRVRKDGIRFWAYVIITALRDENGNLRGFSKVTHDITERKKAEDALRLEKNFTDTVINSMPGIFYVFDDEEQLIRWNKRLEEFSGRSPEGMSTLRPHDFVAEENHGLLESKLRVVFVESRNADVELLLLDREGRKIPFYCTGSPMTVGNRAYLVGLGIDISERRRAEEALRESENKFSKAFQATPSVLVIASLADGRYLEVNEAFERVMGYRHDEVIGRSSLEFNIWQNPEDRAIVLRMLTEGKKVRDLEIGFRSKSGTILVGLYSAEIIEIGAERCLLSLVNDITARKKAEEELRHSEERYRLLYNETPVMLHSIDHDGRLVSVSNYWLETLGYERGEVLGRRTTEFLTEASRRYATEVVLPEFYRTGSCKEVPYQIVNKNGEILDVLFSAIAERDSEGKALRSHAVMVDVTERKRAEDALRKSEDKFSKIFHSVPVLIGISTLAEGRFIDVNEKCLRTLGYQREELIGRTSLELGIWERELERDSAIRALKEQGTVRDLEVNLRSKTGETVSALFSAELIDFDGEQYMISLVSDITERKKAEEEIERLNTDLAARAAELEAANQELEAFNYTVAHDLRKPLTVINSYTQVIKELCGNKLDEKCTAYLEEAYKGTLRMNELIDALLNFSRLAHVEPRREAIDLSAMAHEVAAELQMTEPGRLVTFLITDGISSDGDAALLRVVLDNLLGNAWNYTGMREEAVIEFGVTEVEGEPAYFVRDNGAGFDKKDAAKLFIPFRRLHGTEQFKGFGIGLATVERIIRRHGGKVWAEGEPGRGATFYFTLAN